MAAHCGGTQLRARVCVCHAPARALLWARHGSAAHWWALLLALLLLLLEDLLDERGVLLQVLLHQKLLLEQLGVGTRAAGGATCGSSSSSRGAKHTWRIATSVGSDRAHATTAYLQRVCRVRARCSF